MSKYVESKPGRHRNHWKVHVYGLKNSIYGKRESFFQIDQRMKVKYSKTYTKTTTSLEKNYNKARNIIDVNKNMHDQSHSNTTKSSICLFRSMFTVSQNRIKLIIIMNFYNQQWLYCRHPFLSKLTFWCIFLKYTWNNIKIFKNQGKYFIL